MTKEKNSMDKLLGYISKIGLLIISILFFIFLLVDIYSKRYYIYDFEVPVFDKSNGFSSNELKSSLIDKINFVYAKAGSIKGKNSDVHSFNNPFEIEALGVKSNYNSLLIYIKQKIGVQDGIISCSIQYEGDTYCYKTRKNETLIDQLCLNLSNEKQHLALDTLLSTQAIGLVREIDPYILSMYYYKKKDYSDSKELALESLTRQPEARKFALGTIGNSLRELGELEESEKYYKLCLEEFSDFYHAKWQYAELLLLQERFLKADSLLIDIYNNHKDGKSLSIRSLLKSSCLQQNLENFNKWLGEHGNSKKALMHLKTDLRTTECLRSLTDDKLNEQIVQ